MRQRVDVQVRQDGVGFAERGMVPMATAPFMAQVVQVYSDRMTCDVKTNDGQTLFNIPVLVKGGFVAGKPYGEIDLPAVDDYVIVFYAGFGMRQKAILGTILPYLVNEFNKDAVNSADKQFAKKVLEKDKPLEYRRVFKSGTTLQVEEDGRIVIETPDGTYVFVGGDDKVVKLEDSHGNIITIDSAGMILEDKNGNDISMVSGKVTINGNLEVLQ